MANRRIWFVMVLGSVMLFVAACGARMSHPLPMTGSDEPISQRPDSGSSTVEPNGPIVADSKEKPEAAAGPYLDLILLSPEELPKRLGEPSLVKSIRTKSGIDTGKVLWRYEELGVDVYLDPVSVSRQLAVTEVEQRKGSIIDSLAIGDDADKVAIIMGAITTSPQGEKFAQLMRNERGITVFLVEGKAVRAVIVPTGRED